MRLLHISNDFAGSKVHSNLARHLDALGMEQIIYCPTRRASDDGKNSFASQNISFVYSFCIKPWYKFVYHYKCRQLYKDLKRHVSLQHCDVIHAATLFSDGALAYKAHRKYGIPYCIAVRNTDLNTFIRLAWHAYPLGRKILKHADRIFFISAGIKQQFEHSRFIKPILNDVKDKFVIQPNGIDAYWLQHIRHERKHSHDLLYIGDFSDNKNVCRLIEAVAEIRNDEKFKDTTLTIVGGGKEDNSKTTNLISKHSDFVRYLGPIYDKPTLAKVMAECSLFAMPSIHETFGLVYLEALSQNLPVIYTLGQGIDGMFDSSVGIEVNPKSVEEIKSAIISILRNSSNYHNNNVDFSKFDWKNIAQNYLNHYNNILQAYEK